ncbi:hypothetical protein E0H73_36575 [Kribbella pittospori]|uniref:XRE family transcriptional regulator n=1 Tax=Kribbella pittospori TaxID=722689 RepID=A0A4R0K4X5_9ACTN|nr:hypothetical protein [Kribbella pittospori]TCC55113.1 hypothetical protein E0H73_36575 [Kribbella pittospori]
MTRRKVFDPDAVPSSFWRENDVQTALARRDMGALFRSYLAEFDDCTQTQLALLTEHDRSDVSNWVRGTRHGQVSDIGVLTRIAEGLRLPDSARVLMGLAPANALVSSVLDEREMSASEAGSTGRTDRRRLDDSDMTSVRIAICGSRPDHVNNVAIDAAVRALARLVMVRRLRVNHGPVGVGIEVMTHIADHYQPPGLRGAVAIFGRRNVIADAEYVVIVGGGAGTRAEADLAVAVGKRVLPYGATGGTAQAVLQHMRRNPALSTWMPPDALATLDQCAQLGPGATTIEIERMTDEFVDMLDTIIHADQGEPRA